MLPILLLIIIRIRRDAEYLTLTSAALHGTCEDRAEFSPVDASSIALEDNSSSSSSSISISTGTTVDQANDTTLPTPKQSCSVSTSCPTTMTTMTTTTTQNNDPTSTRVSSATNYHNCCVPSPTPPPSLPLSPTTTTTINTTTTATTTIVNEAQECLAQCNLLFLYADLRLLSATGRIHTKFESLCIDSDRVCKTTSAEMAQLANHSHSDRPPPTMTTTTATSCCCSCCGSGSGGGARNVGVSVVSPVQIMAILLVELRQEVLAQRR